MCPSHGGSREGQRARPAVPVPCLQCSTGQSKSLGGSEDLGTLTWSSKDQSCSLCSLLPSLRFNPDTTISEKPYLGWTPLDGPPVTSASLYHPLTRVDWNHLFTCSPLSLNLNSPTSTLPSFRTWRTSFLYRAVDKMAMSPDKTIHLPRLILLQVG